MKIIYPGSFDPFQAGHFDIINKIMGIYPIDIKITILVLDNDNKKHMFTQDERIEMVINSLWKIMGYGSAANMVESFSGNINDYIAQQKEQVIIVRGLRNNTDFDYEMPYETFTRRFNAQTIYITPNPENIFISSSLVRNLINTNSPYQDLVPWK